MKENIKKLIFIALILSSATACDRGKGDYRKIFSSPDLYSKSVFRLNTVVMGNNFSPVVASRNYLYANVAAYEVVAAGDSTHYTSLAGQVRGLKTIPKPASGQDIDFGFAALLAFWKLGEAVTFSDNETDQYVDSLKAMAKAKGMPEVIFRNSVDYADTVASAIMTWSKKDNYLQTRGMPEFSINPEDESRWIPTPPAYSPATEPHWNRIRPLVLDSANQFQAPPPFKFDIKNKNSEYYKETMMTKLAVDHLTPEQTHIADFWDDNPFKLNVMGHVMYGTKKFSPPGHWMGIVGIAAKKANSDFNTTVYAYTKTAIALFDSFISCWDSKYKYNTIRPESVINKYIDPDWRPHLQTPPFPEYTCGHSTGSAACAEALTSVFGDNFAYTDTTELEFGIANRSYKSFRAAAMENNLARFYGGIHLHYSCQNANHCGTLVGDLVVKRLHMKK